MQKGAVYGILDQVKEFMVDTKQKEGTVWIRCNCYSNISDILHFAPDSRRQLMPFYNKKMYWQSCRPELGNRFATRFRRSCCPVLRWLFLL